MCGNVSSKPHVTDTDSLLNSTSFPLQKQILSSKQIGNDFGYNGKKEKGDQACSKVVGDHWRLYLQRDIKMSRVALWVVALTNALATIAVARSPNRAPEPRNPQKYISKSERCYFGPLRGRVKMEPFVLLAFFFPCFVVLFGQFEANTCYEAKSDLVGFPLFSRHFGCFGFWKPSSPFVLVESFECPKAGFLDILIDFWGRFSWDCKMAFFGL